MRSMEVFLKCFWILRVGHGLCVFFLHWQADLEQGWGSKQMPWQQRWSRQMAWLEVHILSTCCSTNSISAQSARCSSASCAVTPPGTANTKKGSRFGLFFMEFELQAGQRRIHFHPGQPGVALKVCALFRGRLTELPPPYARTKQELQKVVGAPKK